MQFREALNLMGHNADDRRKRDWRMRDDDTKHTSAVSKAGQSILQPPGHEERIAVMMERAEREVPLEFGR